MERPKFISKITNTIRPLAETAKSYGIQAAAATTATVIGLNASGRLHASDNQFNPDQNTSRELGGPTQFYEGWNLTENEFEISVPKAGIQNFLDESISPKENWQAVARYDSDGWKQHFKEAPLPAFNTMNSIESGDDLWVNVSLDATWDPSLPTPTPTPTPEPSPTPTPEPEVCEAEKPENFVKNSCLREEDSEGKPMKWSTSKPEVSKYDKEVGIDDSRSLVMEFRKLDSCGPLLEPEWVYGERIPLKPDRIYDLKFSTKFRIYSNLSQIRSGVRIVPYNAQGEELESLGIGWWPLAEENVWEVKETYLDIRNDDLPDDTATIELRFFAQKSGSTSGCSEEPFGRIWFDNVTLEELQLDGQ